MSSTELLNEPKLQAKHTTVPVLMLIVCCVLWGLSFPTAQDATLTFDRALGPSVSQVGARSAFAAWRYVLAGLAYLALTFPRQREMKLSDLRGGLMVGLATAGGTILQLMGLRYVAPSTSAFLTAMAVIFAPLAQTFLLHRPVSSRAWTSIAMALVGMILLSQSASAEEHLVEAPPFPFAGEIMSLAGSMLFTCQILGIDRWGKKVDSARLTLITMAFGALITFTVGVIAGASPQLQLAAIPELATDFAFVWRFLSLFLLATAIGMHLMSRYQPMLTPAVATVIYCLEPVFGTAFSLLLGNESLTLYTMIGGSVILGAVLLTARE